MSGPETPESGAEEARPTVGGVTRREAIRRIGTGGVSLFGAGLVAGAAGNHAVARAAAIDEPPAGDESQYVDDLRLSGDLPVGPAAGLYGGPFHPPDGLGEGSLDRLTRPPPAEGLYGGELREVQIEVVERTIEVSRGHTVEAWTYNGTVPGPTIRATEGDVIRVGFRNGTEHDHNLHFHGRHSPSHDGWEPVPPGGEAIYEIEAGPVGVHPYHCHTMPIGRHISRGLYGTLIVDPVGGRPPATEVVLALSGFDPQDVGRNDVYAWNGIAGFYEVYPIKVGVGDLVRAYVVNMTEHDPIGSFHLHAQTFDVYPTGNGSKPASHGDVVTLGQMERAMLEFTLPERGRYMFHPHQHRMASRGAMGWFSAI